MAFRGIGSGQVANSCRHKLLSDHHLRLSIEALDDSVLPYRNEIYSALERSHRNQLLPKIFLELFSFLVSLNSSIAGPVTYLYNS